MELGIPLRRLSGLASLIVLASVAAPGAADAQAIPEPAAIERTIPTDLQQRASAPAILAPVDRPRHDVEDHLQFTLGAVNIDGATVFSEQQLSRYFEPYLATEVDQGKLAQMADAITAQYRKSGYVLSYATVPLQNVQAGMVRLAVVEGRIGRVSVQGAGSSERAIESIAASLVRDAPVKQSELERTVGLIRDFPGLTITDIALVRSDVEGLYTLKVNVLPDRMRALSYFDNRGTGSFARSRIYNSVSWSSVGIQGDELRVDLFAMPGKASRYLYGQLLAALPLGHSGIRLSLSASRGDEYLQPNEHFDGRTENVTAQLSYPLMRSRTLTVVGKGSFTDWRTNGSVAHTRLLQDRLRVGRFGVEFNNEGTTHFEGELLLSQGLSFGGMTRVGDPLASRIDASGRFTKASFALQLAKPLSDVLAIRANAVGQFADRPLLSAEQISLGGNKVGRAFKFNELTGDRGLGGGIELSYHLSESKKISGLEFFGFLDAGVVADLKSKSSPARSWSHASAGVGTRFSLAGTMLSIEAAVPRSDAGHHPPRVFLSALRSF